MGPGFGQGVVRIWILMVNGGRGFPSVLCFSGFFKQCSKGSVKMLQGQARGLRLYFVFYVGQEEV